MKKYGSLIAKLRKKNNLTQAQLGEKLNISYQAVSKWENDLSEPDLTTIEKLSNIFNITVSEFFDMANNLNKIYSNNKSDIAKNEVSNNKSRFGLKTFIKHKPWYLVVGLGCIILLLSLIVALAPIKYSSSKIYKMVDPSVFCIKAEYSNTIQTGTGFFINDKGLAVTNYHVIKKCTSGKVQLNNCKIYNIKKVVGYDEDLDIAIIQIDIKKSKPVRLGNSNKVKVGETVYAIGYPQAYALGSMDSTLTQGIVSKKAYTIEGNTYIQTTADITNGNSGGVLVNEQGKVIGITSGQITINGVATNYMNLAIPINKIKSVKRDFNGTLAQLAEKHGNHTVTFMSDGEVYATSTVAYNAKVSSKTITKTGYQFEGWYINSNCTIIFDFNQGIKVNTTLYAKWKANTYIVRFNSNGGNGFMSNMICEYGKEYTLPDNTFTYAHYNFKYWLMTTTSVVYYPNTTKFKNLTTTNNDIVEVKACWELIKYTITYRDKDDKILDSKHVTMVNFPYTLTYCHPNDCHYFDNKLYADRDCTQMVMDGESQISYILQTPRSFDIYLNAYYIKDDFTYSYNGYETWIRNYVGTRKDVYFPSHVNKIYGTAFKDNQSVERVYIPNNIKSISYQCFYGATALKYVQLPSDLVEIPAECFRGCTNLTTVNIPQSVSTIGWGAFANCTSLEYIKLPSIMTEIENSMFSGCSKLKDIVLPTGLTKLGWGAFSDCTSLTIITIPNLVDTINFKTFLNCLSLEQVIIGDNVETIDIYAFMNCTSLQTIYYNGTKEQFETIEVAEGNECFTNAKVYYFASTKPETEGDYWYYDADGNVAVWEY